MRAEIGRGGIIMCKCRKDIEDRLLVQFKEQKEGEEHAVELMGYSLVYGVKNTLNERGFMEAALRYMHTFKNGNKKIKKLSNNILFTFCPFCGEKYMETQGSE